MTMAYELFVTSTSKDSPTLAVTAELAMRNSDSPSARLTISTRALSSVVSSASVMVREEGRMREPVADSSRKVVRWLPDWVLRWISGTSLMERTRRTARWALAENGDEAAALVASTVSSAACWLRSQALKVNDTRPLKWGAGRKRM